MGRAWAQCQQQSSWITVYEKLDPNGALREAFDSEEAVEETMEREDCFLNQYVAHYFILPVHNLEISTTGYAAAAGVS